MSFTESAQNWLGQIILPVTGLGLLGLILRFLMFKATAAKRTMIGYATLTAMTLALATPWLPRFVTISSEAVAPLVRMRDAVVQSTERVIQPANVQVVESAKILSPLDLAWMIYIAIAALVACRLVAGLLKVVRTRLTAELAPIPSEFPVYFHPHISVPVAFDGPSRCIVLPASAQNWTEETLASVVRHEEAHLRHRDGLWLLLGQCLGAIFWFNPIVWLVNRRFRRDIEFLADDEVVLSGVTATSYAQDMLNAAKQARRTHYAAATTFANKASLKQRIASVLSEKKRRERVGMKKLGVAIVSASIATLALAGWQQATGQKVANPTSWSPDVRAGLTVPANPANGFVGVLKDGRKVELIQITQRVGQTLKAWTPDGKTIPAKNIIPVGTASSKRDKLRYLLFRIERSKNSVDMMAALGSGSFGPDEPPTMTFAGGWMLKDDGGPYRYAVSLIEIEETGGATGYFTMSLGDAAWNLEGKVNPNMRFDSSFGSIENLKIKPVVEPQDKLREHWTRDNPGPWLELTWKSKSGREQDDTKQVAVVWTPKGLVEKEPEGSYGGYKDNQYFARYYLSGPLVNLRELRFYSRSYLGVEINGVKLRPNQVP